MASVKFYKRESAPSGAEDGAIWFNSTKNTINLKTGDWIQYGLSNDNLYEGNLQWGGRNLFNDCSPVDAALVSNIGANRLAFYPKEGITALYSRDAGTTWTQIDSGLVIDIFAGGGALYIGNDSNIGIDKSNYQNRIILKTEGHLYAELCKFAIEVSSNGSQGCWVTLDARNKYNVDHNIDEWTVFANKVPLGGWSGWNIINTPVFRTNGGNDDQYEEIRFTFGVTSHSADVKYQGLLIRSIQAFGKFCWTTPNEMARTGHLYTITSDKIAIFPSEIHTTKKIEAGNFYADSSPVALQYHSCNLISSGNEINLVNGFSGSNEIYFNYRNSDIKITATHFYNGLADAGEGGHCNIVVNGVISDSNSASKVFTTNGGTKNISEMEVKSAQGLTWALYE